MACAPDGAEELRSPHQDEPQRDVLIDLSSRDAETSSTAAPPRVRIAVVCMTKKPCHLETWLWHFRDAVGATRFYLRVEDTPELKPLLSSPPWNELVRARFVVRKTVRDWSGQTARQVTFVNDAIDWARDDGITHLLHCDDDELLYLPRGQAALIEALNQLPVDIVNVHALTLEALVPSIECTNPFAEARVFKHRPFDYSSYGSAAHCAGKSLGVIRCKRLCCAGPHHFSRNNVRPADTDDAEAAFDWTGTRVLPPACAVLLHYESCTFDRWILKFTESAAHLLDGGDSVRQGYLFRFYCESLGACRRLHLARRGGRPEAIRAAEVICRELWAQWKLAPDGVQFPPPGHRLHVDKERGLTILQAAAAVAPLDAAAPSPPVLPPEASAVQAAMPPVPPAPNMGRLVVDGSTSAAAGSASTCYPSACSPGCSPLAAVQLSTARSSGWVDDSKTTLRIAAVRPQLCGSGAGRQVTRQRFRARVLTAATRKYV